VWLRMPKLGGYRNGSVRSVHRSEASMPSWATIGFPSCRGRGDPSRSDRAPPYADDGDTAMTNTTGGDDKTRAVRAWEARLTKDDKTIRAWSTAPRARTRAPNVPRRRPGRPVG